jgi:cyclopropane-fatty-acyl-phospholipid synthase
MTVTSQDFTTHDDTAKAGGLGGAILRRLCARLRCGRITIVVPNGARLDHRTDVAGPEATLVIHRWRMLRRLLLSGDVAFGESFIDGDWSSPDPAAVIELAARNEASLSPSPTAPGWRGRSTAFCTGCARTP